MAEPLLSTRAEAVKAWKRLKTMDAPKTYQSWRECQGVPTSPNGEPSTIHSTNYHYQPFYVP